MDIDTLNMMAAEERHYKKWEVEERNRILRMASTKRKQEAWNKLYPKLAVEGLSEEELSKCEVW